jgi:nucleoside-diphosphate-sugar epimerase
LGQSQPHILIVGYGDLGQALGLLLAEDGFSVSGLRRSECSRGGGVSMLVGDVTRPETLTQLAEIDPQILVYCVAASEQTDDSYRAHYVDGLRNVLAALKPATSLKHVFFVSSTRVYGQACDALLDENIAAIPSDFGGQRLLEAEQLLEDVSCGHTVLRLSGIYGPGRRYLLNLVADPLRWPSQNTWTNRIHRDDAAAFVAYLIKQVSSGDMIDACYIVTDSKPVPQHEVLRWLAVSMGCHVGSANAPPPSSGKRLSNARMLATGFRLYYPDYQSGYALLMNPDKLE